MAETEADLQEKAREIQRSVEELAKIEPIKEPDESSSVRIYMNAFNIGSPFYQEVYRSICNYLGAKNEASEASIPENLEKSLRYLGILKKMFARMTSAENENIFREMLRGHRETLPKNKGCNIGSFVFVQQFLGYVWEVYPLINERSKDSFCKELQGLFKLQIKDDPYVYIVFHTTTVMMCSYIIGFYEPDTEKRGKMRQLMRLFINDEETKRDNKYYDLISAIVYFFIVIHASTGKKFEYVITKVILDKVCSIDTPENISLAELFHIEAALQGLLKALHSFKDGTVKSEVFTKEKRSLSLDTWNKIVKFIEDASNIENVSTHSKYKFKFSNLKQYVKEQPSYIMNT